MKKLHQKLVETKRKERKAQKGDITKMGNEKKDEQDELKYNLNTFEKSNCQKVYDLFFGYYKNLYNIGEDLSKLTSEELNDDIILPAKKIFYLGKNYGIIDNEDIIGHKEDLLWLHEFYFIIKKVENCEKEKKNLEKTFISFKRLYNTYASDHMDGEGIDLLLEVFKNITHQYETINIHIEIFLTNLKMEKEQLDVLKYILKENNSKFYKDLFPIFDEIFSGEIENKFKFRETNSEHYYGFLSEDFKEENDDRVKNVDDLQEMLFYYFETKIMKVLNEKQNNYQNNNQNNNQNYLESIAEYFRNFIYYL
jgi:hypothetical protein